MDIGKLTLNILLSPTCSITLKNMTFTDIQEWYYRDDRHKLVYTL